MKARRHPFYPTRFLFLATFIAAPTSTAQSSTQAGEQPELTLDLEHHNGMGSTFALVSATYLLDGKELLQLKGAPLQQRLSSSPLFRAPLPPGLHVIAMRLVYVGHSGVFMYVDRYRFTMQGYLLIESRPGYGVKIISNAQERKSITVQWQNRPTFQLGGLPKKAILSVNVSPIERQQSSKDDEDDNLAPLAIAISEADAKLLESRAGESSSEGTEDKAAAPQLQVDASECDGVTVRFALGQSRLDRAARRSLEQLSACLIRTPAKRIRVEGHCDERGSDALNDRLGQARADETVKFLILRGVMPDRLEAASFGRRRPLCSERTEACYSQNRRAEAFDAQSGASTASRKAPRPRPNRF